MNRRTIQIVPADNWKAVFAVEGEPKDFELAMWALVEDSEGNRLLTGLLPDGKEMTDASEMPGFLGYLAPDRFIDEFENAAAHYEKVPRRNGRRSRMGGL